MPPGGDAAPGCKFCAIVAGTLDAEIVYSDNDVVAFLDHRPLFPGHTLVMPRAHIETLRDLPADALGPFFAVVQRLAVAVQDGMQAQGTFVAENNVVSQSVPHLHVHVVPRRPKDGLRGFFWPRQKYADAAAVHAAGEAVRAALA
ncbi:MAG TPA: HIT family protein [Acidimicrobiia bacterium]